MLNQLPTGGSAPPRRQGSPTPNAQRPTPIERLARFRRFSRWLNLTLVHQALWPLLVVLAAAPTAPPEALSWGWFGLRLAGPALAATLALLYLAQPPPGTASGAADPTAGPSEPAAAKATDPIRAQARFLLIGLPIVVAAARLVAGPAEPAVKLLLFGLADVAAFQLVHFGVVARSYGATDPAAGQAAAVLFFGASWGVREALLAGVEGGDTSIALAAASGVALGLLVGGASRALRRWPGGRLPAAAAHWLVVYLVFGFVG